MSLAAIKHFVVVMFENRSFDNWLFPVVDVIAPGAILAGGSEEIHQMTNVLSDFLGPLSAKGKT